MIQAIYHWHSFVQITSDNSSHNILIDPFVVGNTYCDVEVSELIDQNPTAIVLTHGHSDHVWSTLEIADATDCLVICTYELGIYLQDHWWLDPSQLSTQSIWGSVSYEGFDVKFVTALHGGGIEDMTSGYVCTPAGVLVTVWSHTVHHMWDTGLTKDFELLANFDILVSFVPIGDRYTMWVDDALLAVAMIWPKYAVPIHYNTWPVIKVDDMEFARRVLQENHAVPKILKPWQSIVAN